MTKGDKPGNHDEARSSTRETKGDTPGIHDETRFSRGETKGDKPGNHDETGSSRRETFFFTFIALQPPWIDARPSGGPCTWLET